MFKFKFIVKQDSSFTSSLVYWHLFFTR